MAVAAWLGRRLARPVTALDAQPWERRRAAFDAGEAQVCWLCGPPYVWRKDAGASIELLAAPVMAAARYQGRPEYFSDVIVRAESPHQDFADLRGLTWAINERSSHSGYFVTRQHLAQLGIRGGFFGDVVESGAHQRSLELLLGGRIDATAIDSTVLELALEADPSLAPRIRQIARLGPSPMPPWVMRSDLPAGLRQDLRQAILEMHRDPEGQAALAKGRVARFAPVTDADYDPIRAMLASSEGVGL
jgi:phosphonate transport system substrate-binding protein